MIFAGRSYHPSEDWKEISGSIEDWKETFGLIEGLKESAVGRMHCFFVSIAANNYFSVAVAEFVAVVADGKREKAAPDLKI